jgi:hypothetical protein
MLLKAFIRVAHVFPIVSSPGRIFKKECGLRSKLRLLVADSRNSIGEKSFCGIESFFIMS